MVVAVMMAMPVAVMGGGGFRHAMLLRVEAPIRAF
jgi:hypothetical protein